MPSSASYVNIQDIKPTDISISNIGHISDPYCVAVSTAESVVISLASRHVHILEEQGVFLVFNV